MTIEQETDIEFTETFYSAHPRKDGKWIWAIDTGDTLTSWVGLVDTLEEAQIELLIQDAEDSNTPYTEDECDVLRSHPADYAYLWENVVEAVEPEENERG